MNRVIAVRCRCGKQLPKYATSGSSGMDLHATCRVFIDPGERALVGTGLFLQLPEGLEAQVRSRSGLSHRHGIHVSGGIGTIDSDYRGEILVSLSNSSNETYEVEEGDRIAQLVFCEFIRVDLLTNEGTKKEVEPVREVRGQGGFGSTGA